MIVPHGVDTGIAKTVLTGEIFAIGPVLGPKFGELIGGAVSVGVDRIAEVEKKIRTLRAHRLHHS